MPSRPHAPETGSLLKEQARCARTKYTWCDIQYFQLDPSINLCPDYRQIPFRRKCSDFVEIGFKMLAVVFCLQKIDFPPRPDPQGASRVARIKLFKFGQFSGFRPPVAIFDPSLTLFFRQISFRGLCVKKIPAKIR